MRKRGQLFLKVEVETQKLPSQNHVQVYTLLLLCSLVNFSAFLILRFFIPFFILFLICPFYFFLYISALCYSLFFIFGPIFLCSILVFFWQILLNSFFFYSLFCKPHPNLCYCFNGHPKHCSIDYGTTRTEVNGGITQILSLSKHTNNELQMMLKDQPEVKSTDQKKKYERVNNFKIYIY